MLYGIQRTLATLVLVLLILGWNTSVWAQGSITYGETVQGILDTTDLQFQDGRRFDQYTFTPEAGKSYMITITSSEFPALGWLLLAQGEELIPLQQAIVFQPGAQVQFSGTLGQAGQYTIVVSSSPAVDPNALGTYSVTLSEHAGGAGQCVGGTLESPVMIATGQTLTCMLTDQDAPFQDQQGNEYFGKYFSYQSDGQPFTITAQSNEFPPFLQVYNATGEPVVTGQHTVTVNQLPPGPVLFAVIATQPNTVGSFTISLTQAGTPTTPGTGTLSGTVNFGMSLIAGPSPNWLDRHVNQLRVVACVPTFDMGTRLQSCEPQTVVQLTNYRAGIANNVLADFSITGLTEGTHYLVTLFVDANGDNQWGMTGIEGPRQTNIISPADFLFVPSRTGINIVYDPIVPPTD